MLIEFDAAKNEANIAARGISFELAADFDLHTAIVLRDDRRDYGEERHLLMGRIDGRVHVMVYTLRGLVIRVISLRKANAREVEHYEQAT
ncbi:MAG: BrnT family toxin [Oceanococcaceae bacterium]